MKILRTISAISLSLLVLLASSSFMVGMHFCGGSVVNVSLFSAAEKCVNEKAVAPCHKHEGKSCCKDEAFFHEGQDLKSDIGKLQFSSIHPIYVVQNFILIAEIIPASPLSKVKYFNYDSPLRSFDLTVEHQVFLI